MNLQNIEAEQTLLGLAMMNPILLTNAQQLQAVDFREGLHGRIFAKMCELYSEGREPTPLILKTYFDGDKDLTDLGGGTYLMKLAGSAINLGNFAELAKTVRDCALCRRLKEVCETGLGMLQSAEGAYAEASDLVTQVGTMFDDVESVATMAKVESGKDVGQSLLDSFSLELPVYSTGISSLDRAMGGGIVQGKAYGIAARKKQGKTAMLATIAENLNQKGIKVLYVALEMGSAEISQRIYARRMAVNPVGFIGDSRKREDFQLKALNAQRQDPGNIHFLSLAGITFPELRSQVASAVRKLKTQVVIIDYWQLVGGKTSKQSEAEHLDKVAQWIADGLSKKFKVASITASQINQEGNTRGSEGMRLAFDQVYQLHRVEGIKNAAWMEMMDTRYTPWLDVGSEDEPGLYLNDKGVYFQDMVFQSEAA